MTDSPEIHALAKASAKGATAQIQGILDVLDRDGARALHSDLTRIVGYLSRKHGFQLPEKRKEPIKVG